MINLRPDLRVIAGLVPEGARVLDIGCGPGDLLAHLRDEKAIDGRGIELNPERVNAALARGLSVVQGDADADLKGYPSDAFDIAILSQTLQAVRRPKTVLEELLRVAGATIVSFPNFGHWRVRLSLDTRGRMPVTGSPPAKWYETPNIHLCTVLDFYDLCTEIDARVEEAIALSGKGAPRPIRGPGQISNLFAETAIFKLSAG